VNFRPTTSPHYQLALEMELNAAYLRGREDEKRAIKKALLNGKKVSDILGLDLFFSEGERDGQAQK
jgi:hypothetical protein